MSRLGKMVSGAWWKHTRVNVGQVNRGSCYAGDGGMGVCCQAKKQRLIAATHPTTAGHVKMNERSIVNTVMINGWLICFVPRDIH